MVDGLWGSTLGRRTHTPVLGRGTHAPVPQRKKKWHGKGTDKQINKHTDITTPRTNRPSGPIKWKSCNLVMLYHSGRRLEIQKHWRYFFWGGKDSTAYQSHQGKYFFDKKPDMNLYKIKLSDQIYTNFTKIFVQASWQNTSLKMLGKNLYLWHDCSWGYDDSLSYFVIFQLTKNIVFKEYSFTKKMWRLSRISCYELFKIPSIMIYAMFFLSLKHQNKL